MIATSTGGLDVRSYTNPFSTLRMFKLSTSESFSPQACLIILIEHVDRNTSRSSDTIRFLKGHTAAAHAGCLQSAIAGWMQQVVVKVQNTSGSDLNECSFQGLNSPMAIISGGLGFVNQQAVVIPADNRKDRRLELIFSAYTIIRCQPQATLRRSMLYKRHGW